MFRTTSQCLREPALLLLFATYLGYAIPARAENATDQMKRVVKWLPLQTESLIVSKACHVEQKSFERDGFEPAFPWGIVGALHLIRDGKFIQYLSEEDVLFAAHAACRFRSSTATRAGPNHYAGCHIVCFANDINAEARRRLLQAMAKDADGSIDVNGRTVLRFQEHWRDDEWQFFVAFPAPNVLVVSTDEGYLRALIERIENRPEASFIKNDHLKRGLPYDSILWAVRQYRADVPPSVPPGSVGFVFRMDNGWTEANGRFVAGVNSGTDAVKELWRFFPPDKRDPSVMQVGNGVFRIRYRLNDADGTSGFLIRLLWNLGHGLSST